ncbi:MAG: RAD55 family ATPase, partial [Chloroflexota bacterium]
MNDVHAEAGSANPAGDPTGIPNLDLILGGGIPRGSLIMVVGPPGSGKTTLATQMAFGAAAAGTQVLILTALSEPPSKLVAHALSFTFFDEALIGGAVRILSLEQFLPDGLASTGDELLVLAREMAVGLVVLDGFSGLRGADPHPQMARQFLYHVGSTLSTRATTTIITSEANPGDPTLFPEATTADVIIGLHFDLDGVRRRRGIEVIKVRGRSELP